MEGVKSTPPLLPEGSRSVLFMILWKEWATGPVRVAPSPFVPWIAPALNRQQESAQRATGLRTFFFAIALASTVETYPRQEPRNEVVTSHIYHSSTLFLPY